MRPLPFAALIAAAALILPAAALSPAEKIAAATNIPVEEWRAMTTGRTLVYKIDGAFWALEHYHPGTNRVTLEQSDATCMEGTWDYDPPLYCFHWDLTGTNCFRHARLGDEILIIETDNGADTLLLQSMTAITDVPLACSPPVGT